METRRVSEEMGTIRRLPRALIVVVVGTVDAVQAAAGAVVAGMIDDLAVCECACMSSKHR